jgi:hypothetical protein
MFKSFPEIYNKLKNKFPHLEDNWIKDYIKGEAAFETECDCFPVYIEGITIFLDSVLYIIPSKKIFLIEAYTMFYEEFESNNNFLEDLDSIAYQKDLIKFSPNYPVSSTFKKELELIHRYWKNRDPKYDYGSGRIFFPRDIKKKIVEMFYD